MSHVFRLIFVFLYRSIYAKNLSAFEIISCSIHLYICLPDFERFKIECSMGVCFFMNL